MTSCPNLNDAINCFEMHCKASKAIFVVIGVLFLAGMNAYLEECDWLTKQMSLLSKAEIEMP